MMSAVPVIADSVKPMENQAIVATDLTKWFGEGNTKMTAVNGYRLAVELHAQLPGIDRAQTQRIMDEAHKTCPYSKALRGDTSVKLEAD